MTRKIVDLGENEKPPTIPPLTPAERKYYLSSTPRCDHDAKTFQKWLDAKSLRRERTESATDFAARILQVLRADYEYFYDPDQDKRASVACGLKATDCGGLTYLFVAAMRANDIPARVLVGRHAQPRKPGSNPSQTEYDRLHVRAEMFVANLGWVPVDPAYARESKRPVTAFIGTDSGDLLVLHIDTDLRLPYPDKERVADLLQINPSYWVNGRGTFDGQFAPSGWELKATAIEKK
jgi:transglutaminase-like putative cysteine protease